MAFPSMSQNPWPGCFGYTWRVAEDKVHHGACKKRLEKRILPPKSVSDALMPCPPASQPTPLTDEAVYQVVAAVLHPGNFYVRADLELRWQPPALEEISWEVFRGRLLDP